jgi:hypothetical protein
MRQQNGVQGKLEVEPCHARAAIRVLQKATMAAPDGSPNHTREAALWLTPGTPGRRFSGNSSIQHCWRARRDRVSPGSTGLRNLRGLGGRHGSYISCGSCWLV